MPTILTPSVVMCELIFTHYATRIENVYHVKVPAGAPTVADLNAIRAVFTDWHSPASGTGLRQIQSTICGLAMQRLTSLHSIGAPVVEHVPSPVLFGTVAGNYEPHRTLCVKWSTGLGGRAYRGRTYHCGLPYGVGADGLIAPATIATMQTVYASLITKLATAGYTLCVVSKYQGVQMVNGYRRGIPRSQGVATPIVSVSIERGIDTQRHRKFPHNV